MSKQEQSVEAEGSRNDPCQEETKTMSKRALKRLERIKKWKQGKRPKSKKANAPEPGFGAELYQETDYYYENGLRKVYPYYYTFTTYVKQRWVGRTIIDVFSSEFRAYSELNYRTALENGNLTANGEKVSADYVLKNNEFLTHKIHRHENPVVGCPLEVLVNTDDLIVVNKPSSIPCHPCGKYRHNSVVFIVGRQLGCANLRNIYRLDRLTSGVLMMGKTTKKTKELEDQVLHRQVRKEYVCRVVGHFPDGKIECKEPIGIISEKLGLLRVRSDGKSCHTTFEKVSYNGNTSVVRCHPHTGRTHQIRVHLQYLGHPIVNDPFYNSEAWGPNRNKGGVMEKTDQEVSDRLLELHNIGHWTEGANALYSERLKEIAEHPEVDEAGQSHSVSKVEDKPDGIGVSGPSDTAKDSSANGNCSDLAEGSVLQTQEGDGREPPAKKTRTEKSDSDFQEAKAEEMESDSQKPRTDNSESVSKDTKTEDSTSADRTTAQGLSLSDSIPPFDRRKWIPDVNCQSCQLKYVDPTQKELVMYLHALRYTGPDWEYSTPLPAWAEDDWMED